MSSPSDGETDPDRSLWVQDQRGLHSELHVSLPVCITWNLNIEWTTLPTVRNIVGPAHLIHDVLPRLIIFIFSCSCFSIINSLQPLPPITFSQQQRPCDLLHTYNFTQWINILSPIILSFSLTQSLVPYFWRIPSSCILKITPGKFLLQGYDHLKCYDLAILFV